MKTIHYTQIEPREFNSDAVKGVSGRIAIGKADGAKNFCMRVFEVAENGFTPKHSHDWEHEIFFHKGLGEVLNDGQWIPVEAGYAVFIPGNAEHQIKNTGREKLVFVCLVPSGAPEL